MNSTAVTVTASLFPFDKTSRLPETGSDSRGSTELSFALFAVLWTKEDTEAE
jgi:hypothetical protein